MSKDFFSREEQDRILAAIREAENNTSGELRVHLERLCEGDVLDRAAEVFSMLDMHKTKLRNGVLFYLAWESHLFAVIGDAGINNKVPKGFWDGIKENMVRHFREKDFASGLEEGILKAGEALKTYFPYHESDVNELSDEISFGKD